LRFTRTMCVHSANATVNEEELRKLYRRFKKLDKDGNGVIDKDEFLSIPELAANPLLARVLAIFDTNHDGVVEFNEFIGALSIFSGKGTKEQKLRCNPFTMRARVVMHSTVS
jgi:serine/threonine-protein phosphatase 2B regulatory subunit